MIRVLLFVMVFFYHFPIYSQFIENASFDGRTVSSIPEFWFPCNIESTPDMQPGNWGVNLPASDGNRYISMVVRGASGRASDNIPEALGTRITQSLDINTSYIFSIDLAYDDDFFNNIFAKPALLRVWAGSTNCEKRDLLWTSPVIDHVSWQTYNFVFQGIENFETLIIEAFYEGTTTYNGNILVDHVRIEPLYVDLGDDLSLCLGDTTILQVDEVFDNVIWSDGSTENTLKVFTEGLYWVEVKKDEIILRDSIYINVLEKTCC